VWISHSTSASPAQVLHGVMATLPIREMIVAGVSWVAVADTPAGRLQDQHAQRRGQRRDVGCVPRPGDCSVDNHRGDVVPRVEGGCGISRDMSRHQQLRQSHL
jgi:hypothetical protein